jgi:pyruvate/2-oxoglutarate dehydrogenase complex dihydrolipoamide dehydrogenase (E3) component
VDGIHLLVALGRAPVTKDLDLPAAGIETTAKGFIKVNDRLETNVSGIWAIGDVSGGPQFTHASLDDFRILRDNVFGNGSRSRSDRYVPSINLHHVRVDLLMIGIERVPRGDAR